MILDMTPALSMGRWGRLTRIGKDETVEDSASEESFARLAGDLPTLNTHIIDLIAARSMSEEQIHKALPSLMLETLQAEQVGYEHDSGWF